MDWDTFQAGKEKNQVKLDHWKILLSSLWDKGEYEHHLLPGHEVEEWLHLSLDDYNYEDRQIIDMETNGGG